MTNSETPEEAAARKAEARRLRRQRQNTRNLVASIAASLGLVVFLVLVVARPDESIVPSHRLSTSRGKHRAHCSGTSACPTVG